ncbi:hypothetical protein LCGC14_1364490 [marine sediment metagenome]|uniref:Uncharacterized protein n=1 Tax=marine sediment metagenome TaxID=412755 RepID=A0A0F9K774_9ZZZZ
MADKNQLGKLKISAKFGSELDPARRKSLDRLIRATTSTKLSTEQRNAAIRLLGEVREASPSLIVGPIPRIDVSQRELASLAGFGREPKLAPTPPPPLTGPEVGEAIGATAGSILGGSKSTPLGIGLAATGGAVGRFVGEGGLVSPGRRFETGPGQKVPEGAFRRSGEAFIREGLIEGLFRGFTGIFRAVKGKTITQRALAKEEVKKAQQLGIELPLGQVADSDFLRGLTEVLEKTFGSQAPFQKQRLRIAADINRNFDQLAKSISRPDLNRKQVGDLLRTTIGAIDASVGKRIGAFKELFRTRAPGATVKFSNEQLTQLTSLAQQAANVSDTAVQSKILSIIQPKGNLGPLRNMTEALKDIEELLILKNRKDGSAGAAAKRAQKIVSDAIGTSLDNSGFSTEATQFREAKKRLAQIKEAAENSLLKSLTKFKKPEAIAIGLANKSTGQSTTEAIRTIFPGRKVPRPVRRAFVEEVHQRSLLEGIPVGGRAERVTQVSIREDVIRAVLDKEEADFILKDLVPIINLANIPAKTAAPPSGVSLLALGQVAVASGGAGAIAGGLAAGGVETGESVLALAVIAFALGSPAMLSRVITKRGGIELLKKAGRRKVQSAEAGKLLSRLLILALSDTEEDEKKVLFSKE